MLASASSIACVPPDMASEVWPHVSEMLTAAVIRTGLNHPQDIENSVKGGHALLWIYGRGKEVEAAMTTELLETVIGKVCQIGCVGGENMGDWLRFLGHVEGYARDEGCVAIRAIGRKGWARVLDNYEVTNIVLERRL